MTFVGYDFFILKGCEDIRDVCIDLVLFDKRGNAVDRALWPSSGEGGWCWGLRSCGSCWAKVARKGAWKTDGFAGLVR